MRFIIYRTAIWLEALPKGDNFRSGWRYGNLMSTLSVNLWRRR